ncbi:MAG: holo-ACP synthase, partial [Sphaerochaetaceae bacterium]|nr:holo-ACP synthase [Sphaerochaetaceae bacterium]
MILGLGVDAVSIERVKKLSNHTLEKIFNPAELEEYKTLENAQEDIKAQYLASRFAVKEAYAKARGTGFCDIVIPNEILTVKESDGRPEVILCGKTLDNAPMAAIHVSITHEAPLAIATVILESVR